MTDGNDNRLLDAKSAGEPISDAWSSQQQLRILFVSVPAYGHINPMIPWMKECRARGHKVLFASHKSRSSIAEQVGGEFLEVPGMIPMAEEKKKMESLGICAKISFALDIIGSKNGSIYDIIQDLHRANRIDAIVADFFVSDAIDASDKTGVPVFVVNPNAGAFRMYNVDFWGAPSRFTGTHASMSLWERTVSYLIQLLVFGLIVPFITMKPRYQRWRRGLPSLPGGHPGFPTRESRHVFLCPTRMGFEIPCLTSPLIHYVGVSPPHTAALGGAQEIKKNAKLSAWLQAAEEAGDRILYAAFGSLVEPKPEQTIAMYRAFAKLENVRVIWSLKEKAQKQLSEQLKEAGSGIASCSSIASGEDKVLILSWAPQVALLNHPSVCAYLTHGGYNSTFESLLSQTPMIAYPFFADQPDNAARIVSADIGVRARSLSSDDLVEAIHEALKPNNQRRYRVNLKKIYTLVTSGGGSNRVVDLLEEVNMMGGYDYLIPYEAKQGASTCAGTLAGWMWTAFKYGLAIGLGVYIATISVC